jgi:hypothetical protein
MKSKTKEPSFLPETLFITVILFTSKFYSPNTFAWVTFFAVCIPILVYVISQIVCLVIEFVTSLQTEIENSNTLTQK